jgi:hypothetical protein
MVTTRHAPPSGTFLAWVNDMLVACWSRTYQYEGSVRRGGVAQSGGKPCHPPLFQPLFQGRPIRATQPLAW